MGWLSNDQHLMDLMTRNIWLGLGLVALVVFCETGLVVLPFLPGDSLLFATGAFLGISGISPAGAIGLIGLAAVLGDSTNYAIGRSALGQQLVKRGWIKPQHMQRTRDYFDRYGPTTVTVGRFVPIVRTVAPFVAGLSGMRPRLFMFYNIVGGALWCAGLVLAGYWLGGVPWVRSHMSWVSVIIIAMSVLPVGWQLRKRAAASGA